MKEICKLILYLTSFLSVLFLGWSELTLFVAFCVFVLISGVSALGRLGLLSQLVGSSLWVVFV